MSTTYEEMEMMKEINSFDVDHFVDSCEDTGFFAPINPVEDQILKKVYYDMSNDLLDLDQLNARLRYLKKINKQESKLHKSTVTKRKKISKMTTGHNVTCRITTKRKSQVRIQ